MLVRTLEAKDLQQRVDWVNDRRVNRSMHFQVPITLEGTIKWYESAQINPHRVDLAFEHLGQLCAMGGYTNIVDSPERTGELYIFVKPNSQHLGLGKLATSKLCEYAFYHLHFKSIYLFTNGDNLAAQHVYRQLGFLLTEITHDTATNVDGKVVDRLKFMLNLEGFVPSDEAFFLINDTTIHDYPIKIIRDDIFTDIGGGSKARKALEYEQYLRDCCYNAVVTCGGIQSNHNRAIALMSSRNGWKCHLVYHGSSERFEQEKGNAQLVKATKATVEFVETTQISSAMDLAMNRFQSQGFKPYYIHGGGHDLPGGIAYVKAVQSLYRRCTKKGYKPDYIVHASGTGSTQAGIIVGLELVGWHDVRVVGVSIARNAEHGASVVNEFVGLLKDYYNIKKDLSSSIIFDDRFVTDGYESVNKEEKLFLLNQMQDTGIIYDTTYSGKALWGAKQYLEENKIGGNIIFWHTGGIMNYLA